MSTLTRMDRPAFNFLVSALLLALAPLPLAAQAADVSVVGEVRVRGETDRPAALDTADTFALLRARAGIQARLSPRALALIQVQDARVFGEETSTTDGSAEQLDVHQAWLQYGTSIGSYAASVRAGRQEINLGNERLVGAVGWSNTGRSFDAARITAGPERADWNVSALAAMVQERGRRVPAYEGDDHVLLGAFAEGTMGEVYVLHDVDAIYRLWSDIDRTTMGARLVAPQTGGISAAVEGAYQFGSQVGLFDDIVMNQDIGAYLLAARLGYATPYAPLPRIGIGIDVLSGDESASDDDYSAFNTMYATNHKFYGYIDFFLDPAARTVDRGLIDGMASATLGLPRDTRLDLDVHAFWLQQDLPVDVNRLIGWELDVTLPVRLGPGQLLQLGYSAFRNGPAAEFIGLGEDEDWSHWAYVQASLSFGGPPAPLR